MSHPLIHVNDVHAGEIVEREMTEAEHEHLLAIQAESIANAQAAKKAADARASALAKLSDLGLTALEIKALVGE